MLGVGQMPSLVSQPQVIYLCLVTIGVRDHPLDPDVDLLDEAEQRLPVVCPVAGQAGGGRVLAAGQLKRDLKRVAVHVVKILNMMTIRDIRKVFIFNLNLLLRTCMPPGTSYHWAPFVMPPGKLSPFITRLSIYNFISTVSPLYLHCISTVSPLISTDL